MRRFTTAFVLLALGASVSSVLTAQNNAKLFDKPRAASGPLFPDVTVAKGKGFEIKQSQVDEMYVAFKGHRAAMGQLVPDGMRPRIEADILEKLIATQLFVRRATAADKAQAKQIADTFLAEQQKQALSPESYRRQLLAVGMTPESFSQQIHEQAIVKAVIDREIKAGKTVPDADARKFYADNPSLFQEPELARASHIFISTRDSITGKPLTPELKLHKKQLAEKIAARAKAGEDFSKLVRDFSNDTASKDRGGEYTFARARDLPTQAMAPEFEAAAFSMKVNQVSDIVETSSGYHIIKLLEKIPPKKIEYSKVEARIKESLLRDAVEKELPALIEKLKKEASVEILTAGARK